MRRVPLTNGLRVPVLIALIIWLVFLAVLGSTRAISLGVPDKAQHFVGFGVLSVLVFFAFQGTVPRRKVWVLTVGSMAAACVLSEALQGLLTTREFDGRDIGANFLGTFTFLFAAWMVDRWLIQPRFGSEAAQQYWELDAALEQFEPDVDELDVELDEILVNTPPPRDA
ncbi:hypothetical protein EC988_006416 [Linderina pennispora]|nr:hypothetical protein EC988_006416 [Linderina pennispora]